LIKIHYERIWYSLSHTRSITQWVFIYSQSLLHCYQNSNVPLVGSLLHR